MPGADQERWLAHAAHRSRGGVRLFCFPYAGGAAFAYRGWEKHLPREVELYPVELPGRGSRLREAPESAGVSLKFVVSTTSVSPSQRPTESPYQ